MNPIKRVQPEEEVWVTSRSIGWHWVFSTAMEAYPEHGTLRDCNLVLDNCAENPANAKAFMSVSMHQSFVGSVKDCCCFKKSLSRFGKVFVGKLLEEESNIGSNVKVQEAAKHNALRFEREQAQ